MAIYATTFFFSVLIPIAKANLMARLSSIFQNIRLCAFYWTCFTHSQQIHFDCADSVRRVYCKLICLGSRCWAFGKVCKLWAYPILGGLGPCWVQLAYSSHTLHLWWQIDIRSQIGAAQEYATNSTTGFGGL